MITVIGKGATLTDIRKIEPATPPDAGSRWQPIPHIALIDSIKADAGRRNWEITASQFARNESGSTLAGAFTFKRIEGLPTLPGMSYSLGFINSNDRRKALKLTVGAHIKCCANGLCTGTVLIKRLHDHTVNDLSSIIGEAIDEYSKKAANIPDMVSALQKRPLLDSEASHALVTAARAKLIGWAAVGRVYQEYQRPKFEEHGRGTSWSLLNAFTYAARRNVNPTRQMEAYDEFRQLLPVFKPGESSRVSAKHKAAYN